jgi:hypothetical protein
MASIKTFVNSQRKRVQYDDWTCYYLEVYSLTLQ